jgi:dienelactone hydrolase
MLERHLVLVAVLIVLSSGAVEASDVAFPAALPVTLSITAQLREPTTDRPSAAVVLLHSGGGVAGDAQWAEYQDRLLRAGYASLLVDSYGPRGRTNMPQWEPELARQRIFDAIGAIRYLLTLPKVDKDRIAVIGASDGGRVALELAAGFAPNAPAVNAVVAYYPACPRRPVRTLRAPVLVHEAGLDDWPVRCSELFRTLIDARAPLEVHRYRGAHHGFDNPALVMLLQTPGGSLQYDAASEHAAWNRTLEFLRQHLQPQ